MRRRVGSNQGGKHWKDQRLEEAPPGPAPHTQKERVRESSRNRQSLWEQGTWSKSKEAMSPRDACPALLLLLLTLLSAWPTVDSRETPNQKFQRQHVDPFTRPPYNDVYCNQRMKAQGMTLGICKTKNTFIHAPSSSINSICTGAGTNPHGNYYYSNSNFLITDCTFVSGSPPNGCVYRARSYNQRICIACTGNLPVHYSPVRDCL
ncbi:ribonuclease pancreatic precursor [Alligator mississippiensis]|uniref:Ribonuclease pancreatic n=1 Tax=Alligator mississippiensis TaxID=8496 RepID=A0A151LY34_ALLMI|nr:ribonuclease pancreatic precursor [Alligator mississippiensis]